MQNSQCKMKSVERGVFACCVFHFALIFSACTIPQVPSRIVYEDPINFVRLEESPTYLPEWPPSHHSHPNAISRDDMERILKGLTIQDHRIWLQRWIQGGTPTQIVPAFGEEEVALLATQLSEALAEAKPNERVTYYLSRPESSTKRVVTSGGLYLKDNELHFILGNWKITYGIPSYGMIYDRRYPMSPTAAKGFDLLFDVPTAVIAQKSSIWDTVLANNKDELILDLQKVFPVPAVVNPPLSTNSRVYLQGVADAGGIG
ncbi:MAG: hypothetical protein ACT4OO_14525 [Nitrospiraceae bacterium]